MTTGLIQVRKAPNWIKIGKPLRVKFRFISVVTISKLTTLLCIHVFLEERKMIQLLHNGDAKCGHWMVACQGFFDSPNIRGGKKTKDSYLPRVAIFDSLGVHYSNNPHVLASCASLLRSEAPFFVDIRDCQYQGDTSSCGVFSIAFATSILYGKNPTILVFDKPQMREHLMSCFKKGKLTEFPKVAGLKGIPKGYQLFS